MTDDALPQIIGVTKEKASLPGEADGVFLTHLFREQGKTTFKFQTYDRFNDNKALPPQEIFGVFQALAQVLGDHHISGKMLHAWQIEIAKDAYNKIIKHLEIPAGETIAP